MGGAAGVDCPKFLYLGLLRISGLAQLEDSSIGFEHRVRLQESREYSHTMWETRAKT